MVYQFKLRLAERLKLGGPSLGRSPDAHKQRRLVNKIKSNFSRKLRVDTIFGAGLRPCSFFSRVLVFKAIFFQAITNGNDGIAKSNRAKF